jgi:preprotein translocase subunit SecF
MEFFRFQRDIPFMRHALVFNIISGVTFLAAVVLLAVHGLNLGIDFRGGTVIEVTYGHAVDFNRVRAAIDKLNFGEFAVQSFGTSNSALVRLPLKEGLSSAQLSDRVMTALKADDPTATQQRVEFVGPQVGKELYDNGALALFLVSIGIVAYLAMRFEWRFAVAAIIANLHDVVIILGFFALFQWEFSLPVLAAILAILGYSVNESVVVFDRVRENFRKMRKATVDQVMDASITGTISRTIITHGCTQMMVLSIYFFGGASLHYFALALTIGICFGIYSSVFVASPLVMWLGARRDQFIKPARRPRGRDEHEGAVV